MYVCMYVRTYVCVYVCMYVCIMYGWMDEWMDMYVHKWIVKMRVFSSTPPRRRTSRAPKLDPSICLVGRPAGHAQNKTLSSASSSVYFWHAMAIAFMPRHETCDPMFRVLVSHHFMGSILLWCAHCMDKLTPPPTPSSRDNTWGEGPSFLNSSVYNSRWDRWVVSCLLQDVSDEALSKRRCECESES